MTDKEWLNKLAESYLNIPYVNPEISDTVERLFSIAERIEKCNCQSMLISNNREHAKAIHLMLENVRNTIEISMEKLEDIILEENKIDNGTNHPNPS